MGHGIALAQLMRQRAINERTAAAISINLPLNCSVFAPSIKNFGVFSERLHDFSYKAAQASCLGTRSLMGERVDLV
jgi:hypothetical protein